jgi:hypothetical protein
MQLWGVTDRVGPEIVYASDAVDNRPMLLIVQGLGPVLISGTLASLEDGADLDDPGPPAEQAKPFLPGSQVP